MNGLPSTSDGLAGEKQNQLRFLKIYAKKSFILGAKDNIRVYSRLDWPDNSEEDKKK